MSRTGVEEKPTWQSVPSEVKARVAESLGSPVARAMRIWGGFGPSPTYRLKLENSKRAFFKGTFPGSNDFQRKAHESELRVYRELKKYIEPWAPKLFDEFTSDQWKVMLLEDLGPKTAPPWKKSDARNAAEGLAEFHKSTIDLDTSNFARNIRFSGILKTQFWTSGLSQEKIENLASIAGPNSDIAHRWLEQNAPALAESAQNVLERADSEVLMHLDVRSDNLRVNNGQLRLFDWPHTTVGPPEFEVAAFAQSVEAENGPSAEFVTDRYTEKLALNPIALTSSVAAISGYFANQSWQPAIPGLPRLRAFQRAQLAASLKWASTRLNLEPPTWLESTLP